MCEWWWESKTEGRPEKKRTMHIMLQTVKSINNSNVIFMANLWGNRDAVFWAGSMRQFPAFSRRSMEPQRDLAWGNSFYHRHGGVARGVPRSASLNFSSLLLLVQYYPDTVPFLPCSAISPPPRSVFRKYTQSRHWRDYWRLMCKCLFPVSLCSTQPTSPAVFLYNVKEMFL